MQKLLAIFVFLSVIIIPKALAEKFDLWCFAQEGGTMIFKFDLDNNKVDQFDIDKSSTENLIRWVSLVDTDSSIIFKAYFVEANLSQNKTKMYIVKNFNIMEPGVMKALNGNNLFKFLPNETEILNLTCER
mgnify:FL=1|tara:strand:- start:31 stop:423 length:393 start_codon:yes stop_codon:yes gene_type:complete